MPIYEYQCYECGHQFEKIHLLRPESEIKCPKCGAKAKKVPSVIGYFEFKGKLA